MKHITKTILAAALSIALAFTIIACGGGSSSGGGGNSVPVASAGPDQIVSTGSLVTLDGSGCTDADGNTLTYSWSFNSTPAGSTATLSGSTAVNPTFTAYMNGAYVLSLTVNDGRADSAADTVTITALSAPIANAGPDQIVSTGTLVALDGSGSSGADGTTLTYSWSFTSTPAGSTATLSGSTAVNPTFTAEKDGAYVLSLTVNDGIVDSAADTVTITASTKPVGNAGSDQNVSTGTPASLDGSASADPEGHSLTYSWSFSSVAPTSALSNGDIINATTVNPKFTPDADGAYVVQLIVNNGMVDSPADTVTVTAWPRLLPDTGQTACYNGSGTEIDCAGTGQDGEYSINPMSYTDKEDGTVIDNVTGLMWQQEDDGSDYNWYEASGTYEATYNSSTTDVCGSLVLGGHEDWRLPTKKELVSIVFYNTASSPTIDTTYFPLVWPGPNPLYYWSSTTFADNAANAFMVSFLQGGSGVGGKTDSTYHRVRCVRGGSITKNFTDNGDTVMDNVTGLMWQQTDDGGSTTWQGALDYCNDLLLAGYDDWRLPNMREIDSMADESAYPAIDPTFTLNEINYWSSTSDASGTDSAWSIDINWGDNSTTSKGSYNSVLCVR